MDVADEVDQLRSRGSGLVDSQRQSATNSDATQIASEVGSEVASSIGHDDSGDGVNTSNEADRVGEGGGANTGLELLLTIARGLEG